MMSDFVLFGPQKIEIWPAGQRLESKCGGKALMTRFRDIEFHHPDLTARTLKLEDGDQKARTFFRAAGSSKIYHLEKWGIFAAALIHTRALELFRRALKCADAVADLS